MIENILSAWKSCLGLQNQTQDQEEEEEEGEPPDINHNYARRSRNLDQIPLLSLSFSRNEPVSSSDDDDTGQIGGSSISSTDSYFLSGGRSRYSSHNANHSNNGYETPLTSPYHSARSSTMGGQVYHLDIHKSSNINKDYNHSKQNSEHINPFFLIPSDHPHYRNGMSHGIHDPLPSPLSPFSISNSPLYSAVTANNDPFIDPFITSASKTLQNNPYPGFYLAMAYVHIPHLDRNPNLDPQSQDQSSLLSIQFSGVSNEIEEEDHEDDIWPWEGILGHERTLELRRFEVEEQDWVGSLDCRPSRMSIFDASNEDGVFEGSTDAPKSTLEAVDLTSSTTKPPETNPYAVQIIVSELSSLESSRLESMLARSLSSSSSSSSSSFSSGSPGTIYPTSKTPTSNLPPSTPIIIIRISSTPHRWYRHSNPSSLSNGSTTTSTTAMEGSEPIRLVQLVKASAKIFEKVLEGQEEVIEWSAGVTWRIQRYCLDLRKKDRERKREERGGRKESVDLIQQTPKL